MQFERPLAEFIGIERNNSLAFLGGEHLIEESFERRIDEEERAPPQCLLTLVPSARRATASLTDWGGAASAVGVAGAADATVCEAGGMVAGTGAELADGEEAAGASAAGSAQPLAARTSRPSASPRLQCFIIAGPTSSHLLLSLVIRVVGPWTLPTGL